ncbi:Dolichyl pyrophosphate Man9GlcNAc2 alpha-1,3-glucosyltransferase [Papilio xuthus]|uniref:dolichyl-P-Glc:Man9GlcNAc2-PP-dolichol alpha-1,3-glucosyltransferase n=1 Tax=Papilio xuthus TaxID=66420 RepID=A0A194Q0D2_PAPXU|nr:Dolichyl pyrophosphate Man9GlcNAc2 alpha-1,3-glucosyltransferase [Papilio xuthus]
MVYTEAYIKEKLAKELAAVHVCHIIVDAMRKNTDGFRLSKDFLLPGILFALVVRWCVAAYPYSGYKSPPMYGDFEAQRHWQEITLHTPLTKWYINTTHNDLEYWGLDYPPLTAYHMLFIAYIAEWLDPESVRLFASRGYENENHKEFMRWTVFFSDLYIYVPAAFCLCIEADRVKEVTDESDGCGAKFSAVIVSDKFQGKPLLARHRLVNSVLQEELKTIHAFTQKTLTVEQWKQQS